MAAVAGIAQNVVIERGDDEMSAGENAAYRVKRATVYFDLGAVAYVGGTDTLTIDVGAAISSRVRTGKTITVRQACVEQTFLNAGGTAAATVSLSGNVATVTPKSTDWSTNASISAGAAQRPYALHVVYNET